MKISKTFLIILLTTLCISSCTVFTSKDNGLDGTEWELRYIRKSVPIPGSVIFIVFNNGEMHGSSGCNSYFGEYKISNGSISIGPIAMTEMACLEPEGAMQQEQDYLAFLSEVETYSINGDQLILKKAIQDQLTFEQVQE